MRIRSGGTSKIRGAGRSGTGISPIEVGQAGAGSTRLPDNSYVLNADLEALKQSWPEGYKVLTEQGYTAYSQMVSKAQQPEQMYWFGQKPRFTEGYVQKLLPGAPMYDPGPDFIKAIPGEKPPPGYSLVTAEFKGKYQNRIGSMGGATHEQKMGAQELAKEVGMTYQEALPLVSASGYYDKNAIAKVTTTIPEQAEGAKWQKFGDYRYIEATGGGYILETPGGEKLVSNVAPASGARVEEWEGYKYVKTKEGGYITIDPTGKVSWPSAKEGQEYWAAYTPEVASAIKKLKPYLKPDGSYDWTKIILGSTRVALAAEILIGDTTLEDGTVVTAHEQLKGVRQSIEAYPLLGKALSEGGWEGYSAKWESIHIKLGDGKYMTKEDFNNLYKYDQEHNTKYQGIAIKEGYDAFLKAMSDDQEAAKIALKNYEVPETDPFYVKGEVNYYLDKAIRDKVDEKYLLIMFGKKVVSEAKGEPKKLPISITTIAPVQSVFQVTKSGRELEKKYPEFSQAVISITKTADPMDLSEHYGRWVDAWYDAKAKLGEDKVPTLEQYMVSLNSQMREYRNYIMSLPKDSPERKLFNEELTRRAITAAAFVATAATPYTFGAIGTVGTQIVSKIVPAAIRAIPILGKIPQATVLLTQYLATATPIVYTGATISEAVQTADLEHKWQAFEALPQPKQDAWAKRAGYDNFQPLSDPEKANVLLHYAVPPGYSTQQWSSALGEHTERLIELSRESLVWLQENAPDKLQPMVIPLRIAGGAVVGAVVESTSYMAQLPLISASLIDKVPSGAAKEFAKEVALGMAAFFVTVLPAAFRADPYFTSGRIVGLFLLSPQTLLKLSKSGFAGLSPRFVPERAMAMEFSTVKVKFTAKQAGLLTTMTPAELKALGTNITATLLAGKNYVKGFGALKLEVKTVPYQKVVGNTLWHFTPDITQYKGQTPIVAKLYTSPHAAIKAGIQSLVKGQKATHPGLVEVRVPEGFTIKGAPIEKLLGRGVEIEAPLKGVLDPIPGWQGKGISSNAYFGSYPIRRFTLQGVDTPIAKLTPSRLVGLRSMAMRASVADAFLGWRGRMMAIKGEIASQQALSAKTKLIDNAIKALKKGETQGIQLVEAKTAKIKDTGIAEKKGKLPGDVFDKEGNIIRQAKPYWNQKVGGLVRRRVTAVVTNEAGQILLCTDTVEPKGYYGLPGGNLLIEHLLPGAKRFKVEDAAYLQLQSEVGFGFKNTKQLPAYLGQVNRHSLHGSYVIKGKAESTKIDINMFVRENADLIADLTLPAKERLKLSRPELRDAIWWDGKSLIEVSPATYDIIVKLVKSGELKGVDISKLKISKQTPPELLSARDTKYYRPENLGVGGVGKIPTKVLVKTKLSEATLKKIQQLEQQRGELPSPTLLDYLRGETDFALLHELIAGRQRAVKWSAIKPPEAARSLNEIIGGLKRTTESVRAMSEAKIKDLYGLTKAEILRRIDTKKLEKTKTPEAIQRELDRLAKEQAKLANKRLSQEDIRAYVERGDFINRRYVSYLDRAIRALAAGVVYERLPAELARYRPTPVEIYRKYRAVELSRRYGPIRRSIAEIRGISVRPPERRVPSERIPPGRVPPHRAPPYKPPPYKPQIGRAHV